jgi:mRNA interferase RelE/StbE
MEDRVANMSAPRVLAKKLSGPYEDRMRYRVGDYRLICRIHETILLILVVEVGHRREVYR